MSASASTANRLPAGWTRHDLRHGVIVDWLATDAVAEPVDLRAAFAASGRPDEDRWILTRNPDADGVKRAIVAGAPPRQRPSAPVEGAPATVAGVARRWLRRRAGEDGYLEWGGFAARPRHERACAGVTLSVGAGGPLVVELSSTGPLTVWLGPQEVHRDAIVSSSCPVTRCLELDVDAGRHDLVVATEQVGLRDYRHLLRVALRGGDLGVWLACPSADAHASAAAERLLDGVGVVGRGLRDRWLVRGEPGATLTVGSDGRQQAVRLAGGEGEIDPARLAGDDGDGGRAISAVRRGDVSLRIGLPDPGVPVIREVPAALPPRSPGAAPTTAEQRRRELLEHAAGEGAGSTAGALARLALGGGDVPADWLGESVAMVTDRADCADFEVLGLLNTVVRARRRGLSGGWTDDAVDALRGFRYWIDQPGHDCMCFFTENHQIAFHAAETLAGELLEGETLSNTGWPAERHAAQGAARCGAWIRRKLREGFIEFDSNTYLAIDVLALASLVDLSGRPDLRAMATAALDKALFQLAATSWHGVHGSAHGRSYAQALLDPRLEETSPIQRLLWGRGTLNGALLPSVVLADTAGYRLPEAIAGVATADVPAWEGRHRQAGTYEPDVDLRSGAWESASVVWRTPDGMLASVQDHRPGRLGRQEHVWGATLGPSVHVFANHPANTSLSPSARPNYWAGNHVLPRVRQHRDALLAVYAFPPGDPLGFTHGWFPTAAMDEWVREGPWLAGRVGDGYVALASDAPLEVLDRGPNAANEIRPRGAGSAWVCQLGRRAEHGTLADFARRLAFPEVAGDRVRYRTPAGTLLELGWDAGWRVDAAPEPTASFPHVGCPAATAALGDPRLEIRWSDRTHVLDLAEARRSTTP